MSIFQTLDQIIEKLLNFVGKISMFLMMLLAIFITFLILSRHGLGINIRGLFDIATYVLVIFTFLSLAYTLKEKDHITVDILTSHINQLGKTVLDIMSYAFALIYPIILIWSSGSWAYDSFLKRLLTVSEVPIPRYILVATITIGAILLVFQMIRTLINRINVLITLRQETKTEEKTWQDKPLIYVAAFIFGIVLSLLLVKINLMLGVGLLVLVLLFSGMPVFLALGLTGTAGLFFLMGTTGFGQISFLVFRGVNSFPLTCLPLFILAGIILGNGKIVEMVLALFDTLTGRLATGLLITTIFVGAFFCAVCGSSVASTAVIAAILLPILFEKGYNKSLSCGVVAGSTIGTVIPPSVGYIVYGVTTNTSIGKLFIAGIGPGAVIFGMYIIYIIVLGVVNRKALYEKGEIPPRPPVTKLTFDQKLQVFKNSLWGLVLPVVIIGGIYMGIFTPTEAAAVLAVYAIVVCVFILKTIPFKTLIDNAEESVRISSMILAIITSAMVLGAVISQYRLAETLFSFFEASVSSTVVLIFIFAVLFVLGMFLDSASIMLITLPVFFPIAMSAGIDPIWFGVFYIITTEIGLRTPPVGLSLFSIAGVTRLPLSIISWGTFPFLLILILSLVIFMYFPQIVLWLPNAMR